VPWSENQKKEELTGCVTFRIVVKPKFMPFMRSLGPGFIAQEDNASSHRSKWVKQYWEKSGIELMKWPPNSPDLSAIEPPWRHLKWKQGASGPITSKRKMTKVWKKNWKEMDMKLLQRFVYRIQGNTYTMGDSMLGGNDYKEGTSPPPLTLQEREKLADEIEDFL